MVSRRLHDAPLLDRPRERLRDRGAKSLSTPELLAILLRTGREGASAVDVGQELLRQFGSLESISRSSVAELIHVEGIGESKAAQILAAFELGIRLQQNSTSRLAIDSSKCVWKRLEQEMRQLAHESLRVMVLNVRRELIAIEEVTQGILNEVLIHPREVFRPAIIHRGYGIIVAHNHPSGDPTPSRCDLEQTRELQASGKTLGIPLLDHVILGNGTSAGNAPYFSFVDAGLL